MTLTTTPKERRISPTAFKIGQSLTEAFRAGQRNRLRGLFNGFLDDATPEEVSFLVEALEMRDNLTGAGAVGDPMPILEALGVDCENQRVTLDHVPARKPVTSAKPFSARRATA